MLAAPRTTTFFDFLATRNIHYIRISKSNQLQTRTMFAKHMPRLFVFKFLGLFSASPWKQNLDVEEQENDVKSAKNDRKIDQLRDAQNRSSKQILELMLTKGIPGVTVSVAKRGEILWSAAFGFCDVENQLECIPDARMRVASISKPIFVATVIAPMIEQDKLDISSSVHKYLTTDEFPKQTYKGKESDITIEQLLSHTSGIKHYGDIDRSLRPIGSAGSQKIYQGDEQYNRIGFYQRKTFRSVLDALELFKAGPLDKEPGQFHYTTYGFTLLSAVAEKVHQQSATDDKTRKEQIEDYWVKVLRRDWDLKETSLDQDEPIISNRARYYVRSSRDGGLVNAPYADNSVKWAGGGLNSNVKDLAKFGVALVDSYKKREWSKLKRETIELLWTPRKLTYGLGFNTKSLDPDESSEEERAIYHTGHAVGASSVLIIYPKSEVVVAMLANLENVYLGDVGFKIADAFAKKFASN